MLRTTCWTILAAIVAVTFSGCTANSSHTTKPIAPQAAPPTNVADTRPATTGPTTRATTAPAAAPSLATRPPATGPAASAPATAPTSAPATTRPTPASTAAPANTRTTSAPTSSPASQPAPTGLRFKLPTVGEVFVPDYLPAGLSKVDVLVHLHGAASVTERELVAARLKAVLITVHYGGLSGAYEKPFSNAALFRTILDEALAALKKRECVAAGAEWQHVCVSSFSAGFGGVRALLKVPEYFERIDALYLADTVYAGYLQENGHRRVDPANMEDFRRFASEAAAGRKTMFITHSYLEPGSYAGTHETADDLIDFVGAHRQTVDEPGPAGMRIISRAEKAGFIVRGCAGKTGEDHMAHLRNMGFWYPRLPLDRVGD
jgi:hypothetical protein